MKGTAYLVDTFRDFSTEDVLPPAFNRAHSGAPLFEWYEMPGNEHQFRRFAAAMSGISKALTPDTALAGAL